MLNYTLFILGNNTPNKIKKFCAMAQQEYPELNFENFYTQFMEDEVQEMVGTGVGFCIGPSDKVQTIVHVPERDDSESVLYHEIVHLVDFIMEYAGISNDTEVRAYLFQYYESTVKEALSKCKNKILR